MIFIAVKFNVHPERAERWAAFVEEFTNATRNEPGNIFFEWSRDLDDPNRYVLLEAFKTTPPKRMCSRNTSSRPAP